MFAKTSSVAKPGQIVRLSNLRGNRRLSLKEIAVATNVSLSTCSEIIQLSTLCMLEIKIRDLCSEENLRSRATAIKGQNQALTEEDKKRVIEIALQDPLHGHKTLHELVSESELQICSNRL